MKSVKKLLVTALAAALLLMPCALHASAEEIQENTDDSVVSAEFTPADETDDSSDPTDLSDPTEVTEITVTVRIEGLDSALFYGDVTVEGEDPTVTDVMFALNEKEDSLNMEITNSQYGYYITSINELAATHFGGLDGWCFLINGESPDVGMDGVSVHMGDSIVFYFNDAYGIGMQYPEMDTSKLESDGILAFTSKDTTYDENWNITVTINPVAGMTVVWGMEDGTTYTAITDENGNVTIPAEYRTAGTHTVAVSRYAENGCPTVLRFAPGTVVTLEKSAELPVPNESPVLAAESTANPITGDCFPMGATVVMVSALLCGLALAVKRREA